jgi:pectate lyase
MISHVSLQATLVLGLLGALLVSVVPVQAAAPPTGFASVHALGLKGTSGGAAGMTVTVTNSSQFLKAVAQVGPMTIQVQGLISLPGPMHAVSSDKTIVGVGRSGITGAGLNFKGVSNVIVRNLVFTNSPDDAISIESFSHHIWIDHCDLSMARDGLLDIKHGADLITVSWNHFHHHDKTTLVGHSDDNEAQDAGRLRVTYHHNWFDCTGQRHPRVRFGEPVHVFNNYYSTLGNYGVAAQRNSGVLIEGNYFEKVKKPARNNISRDPLPGRIVERSNVFINGGAPVSFGKVVEPSGFYSYRLDPAVEIKALVTGSAGITRAEMP